MYKFPYPCVIENYVLLQIWKYTTYNGVILNVQHYKQITIILEFTIWLSSMDYGVLPF